MVSSGDRGGRSDPQPLADSLDSLVRSLHGGSQRAGAAAMGGVFGRWTEVVGEAMAAHVQPVKLERDRLLVEVRDPAWATQVRMLSDRIRERLHEVVGISVETIDVRVAGTTPRR